jgi:uncharacterized protein (TIGR00299 family) protein
MRTLYLDCFSGISGDMILGTLIDLGLSADRLNEELGKVAPSGCRIAAREVSRGGLRGIRCEVEPGDGGGFRNLQAIEATLESSRLDASIRDRARRVFRALGAAEARLHGVPIDEVHFHELGAVDTVVDVVGACVGLDVLGIEKLLCSPLNLGSGTVNTEHGVLPVPSPAAAALLQGRSVYSSGIEGELVTPTGAAIVATLAEESPAMPSLAVDRIGYGAGSRDYSDHPNLLRGFLGELTRDAVYRERVVVIETTIDDMNPQNYTHLMERLFEDGAHEVFLAPVLMKKGRPGTLLTAIVPGKAMPAVTRSIFTESTTIGFRFQETDRIELEQDFVPVKTRFGKVNVKASSYAGEIMQATPEYEDCRKLARDKGVPLQQVQEEALAAYRKSQDKKK